MIWNPPTTPLLLSTFFTLLSLWMIHNFWVVCQPYQRYSIEHIASQHAVGLYLFFICQPNLCCYTFLEKKYKNIGKYLEEPFASKNKVIRHCMLWHSILCESTSRTILGCNKLTWACSITDKINMTGIVINITAQINKKGNPISEKNELS